MRTPDMMMPQRVILEALEGSTATGAVFAPPTDPVRAAVDDQETLVRNSAGAEVVSATTVLLDLENWVSAGSKVTVWPGMPQQRTAKVITSATFQNAFQSIVQLKLE